MEVSWARLKRERYIAFLDLVLIRNRLSQFAFRIINIITQDKDDLNMTNTQVDKCFVVMPFGLKPKNDGSGDIYDFDKVYRVIIQRAILQAGMEPIRADETKGSRMIHTDMFKDLRDRPIVLADLSLYNPNVFYELGIRHVMSPSGTVLICCKGADLP